VTAERKQVLVVGGGVIGLACAHFLERGGCRVTVIDQGAIGAGCSHANCGLVCPSHVLPLAEPGAAWRAFKSLFQRGAPLAIRPRWDPGLWAWLARFARRCNRRDMLESADASNPLLRSSMALYGELAQEEALDCEWQVNGLLFAFRDRREFLAWQQVDDLLRTRYQLGAERLDGDAVTGFEPALRPGLAGGWYYAHDAQLKPDKLVASWRATLEGRGVRFLEGCAIKGIEPACEWARLAHTSLGPIEADAFVLATGAWTSRLGRLLGRTPPIVPGKGYSLTMKRPACCPRVPIIFPETRVAVTPFRTQYRLGSTMEFAGFDARIDRRRLQLLRDGAAPFLQQPCGEPVIEEWCGWRPMTYDSLPIIDKSPRQPNVFVAAGHNMLGVSMAPATGKLLAELVLGRPPHIDHAPYSILRFDRRGRRQNAAIDASIR
jgi:D-amino-acid dehydrogenase